MELLRSLIVLFMVVLLSIVMLRVADVFASWYENQGRTIMGREAEQIAETIDESMGITRDYNVSDYDIYEKSKPYLQPLDIALSLAFLAALVGIFIYNKERT